MMLVSTIVARAGLARRLDALARSASTATSLANLLAIAAGTAIGSNLINTIPMTIVESRHCVRPC